VTTDETGSFAFTALPAGSYSLQVDKSTYLAARYPDAGQTLRTGFRPVALTDGQALDGVTVPMFHGSAISGRVIDAHGDPLENVEVRSMLLPKSGRGRPQMRSSSSTNDIGEFRVARLAAGRYILMVVPRRFDFNPNEPVVAEVQPLPTYYPGVLALEQAQPITVERGVSITGLDVMALDGLNAVVSGVVVNPSGQPLRGNGSIMARLVTDTIGFSGAPTSNSMIKPDGSFQLKLPPGEYQIEARGAQPQTQPGDQPLVGTARVSVAGDLSGLAIILGGGARVSGKVVFEGANEPPPFPTTGNIGQMRVTFGSPDGSLCQSGRSQLQPDWTFTVESVTGTCRANFAGNIPKWTLKAIMYDGKDMLDRTVQFDNGQQLKDVQIIFTDKRTELTLQVDDEEGKPTREYVGLVFTTDKTRWDPNGSARYIRPVVPQPALPNGAAPPISTTTMTINGTYVGSTAMFMPGNGVGTARPDMVAGMPAGEYYAVAIDDIDAESIRDPDVLEQLSRAATRVALAEGSPAQLSLRRVKLSSVVAGR
jgi:hypothetical protein